MHNHLYFKKELYRKYIHICSITIPLSIWYLKEEIIIPTLIFLGIILPLLDYYRRHSINLNKFYYNLFDFVTRSSENKVLTGASWIFISASIVSIIFDKNTVITSLFILSLSDSIASIIGIKYGKTKLFLKTLEGSTAFFISTILIVSFLTTLPLLQALVLSFLITIIENLSNKINDNITIPITSAILLTIIK